MKMRDLGLPLIVFLGFVFLNHVVDLFYLVGITEEASQVFFNTYFISLFFLDMIFVYKLFTDLYYTDKT